MLFHYAGRVNYDPKLFLEKNKDTLFKDIEDCLAESTVPLIARMFGDNPPGAAAAAAAAVSGGGEGGGKARRRRWGGVSVRSWTA